jgi:hypothetical protein
MREQLVDGAIAGDDGLGRDRIEVIQTLDELGRGQPGRDLIRGGQPNDRERDRGLPTRGREFVSGRTERRVLPRWADQEGRV